MKLSSSSSSKSISSPGRTGPATFPPPLLRFLRSNAGSRSRPRSRPTPFFLRRKKTTATTQEPSSPKVTCIGQVRVRRSKYSGLRKPGSKKKKTRCHYCLCNCSFFRNPCLCSCNSINWKLFQPVWCIWARVFSCGSPDVRNDSAQNRSNRVEEDVKRNEEREIEEREIEEREKGVESSASESTPPKNALLLTRCRSAPYRSSSLACRLWGSTLREEKERETGSLKTEQESIATKPALGIELSGRVSVMGSREDREVKTNEGSLGNGAAIDDSLKERPPLLKLMRCRSEPMRRGSEKLDPLTSEFWRERRLSSTESSVPL